ncbi:MAG: hypothetical protein SGBAC_011969 [Bacillariaceae sp.]
MNDETIQLLPTYEEHQRDKIIANSDRTNDVSSSAMMVNAYAIIWTSMILFGAFALFQYILPAFVEGDWERWNKTDPGLYRTNKPRANNIMVAHMICGVFLQALGPIQLIPAFRRKYVRVHRILGRIYIGAALGASSLATVYVLLYRTSRQWIHEDIGNVIFGVAVFGSACMSLWYIRKGDIPNHQIWSVRLFLAVFGATLFRIVAVPYALVVLLGAPSSQTVLNSLFYVIVLPSWLGYEVLVVRRQEQEQHQWQRVVDKHKPTILMTFVVVWAILTLMIFIGAWLPAMLNQPSLNSAALTQR